MDVKESSINEVLVDLTDLMGVVEKPQEATKEKSKYYISFSNDYEVFEDLKNEITYENTSGELLLDIINKKNEFFSALMEYVAKTKESIRTIQKAVVVNLFDHYQYIEKLREDLEKCDINPSIIKKDKTFMKSITDFNNNYMIKQIDALNKVNNKTYDLINNNK